MNDSVRNEHLPQVQQQSEDLPVLATDIGALVLDEANFNNMERVAKLMASGRSTIPDHLKNNVGDCMAIVMQSVQWKLNPWGVAPKTHFVNGQIGYEAQLVNAVINSMAPTKDRLHYEWYGDWTKVIGKFEIKKKEAHGKPGDKDYKKAYEYRVPGWSMKDEEGLGVRVWATLKGEDEPRVLDLLLSQASVRNSPLWASDPKQQLAYLGVKRWARLYCPDVIMGVYTPDEFEHPPMKDINPAPSRPADVARGRQQQQQGPSEKLLAEARDSADKGRVAFADFWKKIKGIDRNALRSELQDLEARVAAAEKKVVDVEATEKQEPPKSTANAPVDDEFVRQMDAAEGKGGDYAGGYTPE